MMVDIVIPTWKRPEKLARCLASIERQTYPKIRVHAVEDTERLFAFGVWNRFLLDWMDGDLFVYLCDDTELEPGCIEAAVDAFELRWPDLDGVVGFHQSNIVGQGGWCSSAMGMVGRVFAERFPGRQVFCPDYSRFHADSELGAYARILGRFVYCEQASLVHFHPAHCKSEMDETHRVVRTPAEVMQDRATWRARKAAGVLWGQDFALVNAWQGGGAA